MRWLGGAATKALRTPTVRSAQDKASLPPRADASVRYHAPSETLPPDTILFRTLARNEPAEREVIAAIAAVRSGETADVLRLTGAVRERGVQETATRPARDAALAVLPRLAGDAPEMLAARHVLASLAYSPLTAPRLTDYMATSLVAVAATTTIRERLARTAVTVAQVGEVLTGLPSVVTNPQFSKIRGTSESIRDVVRSLAFGPERIAPVPSVCVEAVLVNEGPSPAELLFIAATISMLLVFEALAEALRDALANIARSDIAAAVDTLNAARRFSVLLIHPWGYFAGMTLEEWLITRRYIELPSAIQAHAYHDAVGRLNEVVRCHAHERWDKSEVALLGRSLCQVIDAVGERFRRWNKIHLQVLTKYAGPPGTRPPAASNYLVARGGPAREMDAAGCPASWCPLRDGCGGSGPLGKAA